MKNIIIAVCALLTGAGAARAQMSLPVPTQQKSLLKSTTHELVQKASLSFAWTPSLNAGGLDMTETNLSFTSMLPLPLPSVLRERTKMTLLSITPNFKYTHAKWDGAGFFPESLYSGGASVGLISILDERRRVICNVLPAYSSDGKATSHTVVCPAMLALNYTLNEKWNLTVGVIYLDRSDIPALPIGGAIYTPNEDTRLELMMPQIKFAKRFQTSPNWWFVSGGFSGGSWAFRSVGDQDDFAMLREYLIKCGWEQVYTSAKLTCEIGCVFGREIRFDRKTQNSIKPSDSLNLRWVLAF